MSELRERVAAVYAATDRPSWPNPHPDGRDASEEEYSRVTDPDRYRVVLDRARVWLDVLVDELGAVVAPASGSGPPSGMPTTDSPDPLFSRRVLVSVPGVVPLSLVRGSGSPPSLVLAAGDGSWTLDQVPDCGCDACDFGSETLLEAVDDAISDFVEGPVVLFRGLRWTSRWSPRVNEAGGTPGHPDFDLLMGWSRQLSEGAQVDLPSGTEVLVSRSWLPAVSTDSGISLWAVG